MAEVTRAASTSNDRGATIITIPFAFSEALQRCCSYVSLQLLASTAAADEQNTLSKNLYSDAI